MSTFKGLIKNEVYSNLKQCIIQKKIDKGLLYVVDLACTKNELSNLINFFIAYFSQNLLNASANFIKCFTFKIERLDKMPRKGILDNKSFQDTVIEIFLLLCIKKARINKIENIKDNISIIKSELGRCSFDHQEHDVIDDEFKMDLSVDFLYKMIALIELLNKRNTILCVGLTYLCVTCSDAYNVGEIKTINNRNTFRYEKKKIKHISFYIWKIIHRYVEENMPNLKPVYQDFFTLFNTGLAKKTFSDRINILLYCIYLLTSDKQINFHDDVQDKIRSLNINSTAIFNKVLNMGEKGDKQSNGNVNTINETKPEVSSSIKDIKHDYLKCVTFVDDNNCVNKNVKREREREREEKMITFDY